MREVELATLNPNGMNRKVQHGIDEAIKACTTELPEGARKQDATKRRDPLDKNWHCHNAGY